MKTAIYLIFTFLLIISSAFSEAKLEFSTDKVDFGYIPRNSVLVHDFWFKSTGTDTLRIIEIKPGCACQTAELERDFIPPGDSMKVTMVWEVKQRVGSARKYPYIYTNARDVAYRIFMDCKVMSDPSILSNNIGVSPFRIEFSKVGSKNIDSVQFEIENKFEHDLMLKMVSLDNKRFNCTIPEVIPGLSTAYGNIILSPQFADSQFVTYFTFEASDKNSTRVTIPVRRKIYK